MSQTFNLPSKEQAAGTAVDNMADSLSALRTGFLGTTAPSNPVAGQVWKDTTTKTVKEYDGSEWRITGPLYANGAIETVVLRNTGSLSSDTNLLIPPSSEKTVIVAVRIVSSTPITANASNKWGFSLTNLTQTLELFSTDPDTEATTSGIGGGAVTADTAYVLLADQNTVFDADDVGEFSVTKTGSPDALGDSGELVIAVTRYARGA